MPQFLTVSPLGSDSVAEINKVFDWASSNPRGTILLIDEADALFRKRTEHLSESLRNSVNSFLYRTGTPSKRFMLVIATNQPQQLDQALVDRIGNILSFYIFLGIYYRFFCVLSFFVILSYFSFY
jgi:ATPase family AAA domain-containing protein 3A/B